jgi:hypothetical protein
MEGRKSLGGLTVSAEHLGIVIGDRDEQRLGLRAVEGVAFAAPEHSE